MKHVSTVSTKVSKNGAEKATVLTVDFEGASLDAIKAYAVQAIKVKVQGRWRQDGIPDTYTFKVADNPVGAKMPAKPTVAGIKSMYDTMTADEKLALYKQLEEESKARESTDEGETTE